MENAHPDAMRPRTPFNMFTTFIIRSIVSMRVRATLRGRGSRGNSVGIQNGLGRVCVRVSVRGCAAVCEHSHASE